MAALSVAVFASVRRFLVSRFILDVNVSTWFCSRASEAGGRRQQAGGGRQEAGGRRQVGSRRQRGHSS